MNTLGTYLRLTTFGESHGPAIGGILDGFPAGLKIDMKQVEGMIDRRRTGRSPLTSGRREADTPEILSGISSDGITLGTPIGYIFRNTDARPADYDHLADLYRPNHADFTYTVKYGIRDHRGGGRASARETLNWVMAGALTMQLLRRHDIRIEARLTAAGRAGYPDPLGKIIASPYDPALPNDDDTERRMKEEIDMARRDCDSVGGKVSCLITGLPAGVGEPVFSKLQSRLAAAMMSLNAAKDFEYGEGGNLSLCRGAETIDEFLPHFFPGPMRTDRHGGILGGISTGMPVCFNVYFKPTPTISRPLPMADRYGYIRTVNPRGRHDPCVAMRAPVVVEALAALTVADMMMAGGYLPHRY